MPQRRRKAIPGNIMKEITILVFNAASDFKTVLNILDVARRYNEVIDTSLTKELLMAWEFADHTKEISTYKVGFKFGVGDAVSFVYELGRKGVKAYDFIVNEVRI